MFTIVKREAEFFDKYWQDTEPERIRGFLQIPEVLNLRGAKILICSCGSGVEPVLAANAGAEVFTFDISPVAIEKAYAVAQANNVSIKADVMNFHELNYPDNFFDFIYGSLILHHIDCEKAGNEIYRCLKPNGIAYFWENSDRNPLLRWARRILFGFPGGNQRQKFLFFRRKGTVDEYPLTETELMTLSNIFGGHIKRIYSEFIFFQVIVNFFPNNEILKKITRNIDILLVKLFPAVLPYSFGQGVWLQKKVGAHQWGR
jgi:ubiquinone/menaquinone biosynthesis C-methylase UbiE